MECKRRDVMGCDGCHGCAGKQRSFAEVTRELQKAMRLLPGSSGQARKDLERSIKSLNREVQKLIAQYHTGSPKIELVSAPRSPRASTAPDHLVATRQALTKYAAAVRKGKPEQGRLEFWRSFLLSQAHWSKLNLVDDPDWQDPAQEFDLAAEWLARHPDHSRDAFEATAGALRAVLSKLNSATKKGEISAQGYTLAIALANRLIAMGDVAPQAAPKPAKAVKERKAKEPKRKATDRCKGSKDEILACIRREGGIRAGSPEAGELRAAAGGKLQPGIVTRRGMSWDHMAEVLEAQGYVKPDDRGRLDSQMTLNLVAERIRTGRPVHTDYSDHAQESVEQEFARRYAAGEFGTLPPGRYEIIEG